MANVYIAIGDARLISVDDIAEFHFPIAENQKTGTVDCRIDAVLNSGVRCRLDGSFDSIESAKKYLTDNVPGFTILKWEK